MFDENEFRGLMAKNRIPLTKVAEILGIAPTTLYRKMSGESDFTRSEIQKVREISGEENLDYIFFAPDIT